MDSWVAGVAAALSIGLTSFVVDLWRWKAGQKKRTSSASVARSRPALTPPTPQSTWNPNDWKTPVIKTMQLTGNQAIPGLVRLEYRLESPNHWLGSLKRKEQSFYDEIYIYGDAEGLQTERIATAQKIIPVWDALEARGRIEVINHFAEGTDPFNDWGLQFVYFGFTGSEPVDEFSLHFCWGPWDCSRLYYAKYRLNSENPVESILLELGKENELL